MRVVLDVSAAFTNIQTAGQNKPIYRAWLESQVSMAPTLFHAEASNTAWKYTLIKGFSTDDSINLLEKALHQVEIFYPVEELNEESLRMAYQIQHPVYDCYYLVLAQRMNGILLSNDRKLLEKAKAIGIPTVSNLS